MLARSHVSWASITSSPPLPSSLFSFSLLMVTMSATLSIGENPTLSPANPSPENNMETAAAAAAKRPRRYNFSLPTFSWGAQRVVPWVKDHAISSDATLPPLPPNQKDKEKEKEKLVVAEIPWNLRKRKADTSCPVDNGGAVELVPPPVVVANEKEKEKVKEKKNTKLSVPLSSMEIRDDFLLMKGKKPASRPKKRPKHVQKLLDELFPGLWLSEITPDLYKVDEEEGPCDSDS